MNRIPRALTIAGSDSGGGAGIQADLKTFAALGVFGMSAITALTAQNTVGVDGIVEIDPSFVSLQIHAVVKDIGADAVKTGMLANAGIISQVAADLRSLDLPNVVVDPVMVSKSGHSLLRADAVEALVRELLPVALIVTPNLQEASALTGMPVKEAGDMREAARRIKDFGVGYVVVKGGHLEGTPMDLLYDGRDFIELTNERFETPHTHGTGCSFASAVAAGLARGWTVKDSVFRAKHFISGAIRSGLSVGKGHGPVHHFWGLYGLAGWC